MTIIKLIIYALILSISTLIGRTISKTYQDRCLELREMKSALNIFKTKIKFTYDPIPKIFKEISENLNTNIKEIFEKSVINMQNTSADIAWKESFNEKLDCNLDKEDIAVIKSLSDLLGKTDIIGQVNKIDEVICLLDNQIEKANDIRKKEEKMYKTLGTVIGIAIVIIII